jgi:type 1 glutamine amidotransferase
MAGRNGNQFFDGAASLVFYMDGRGGHPVVQGDRLAKLRQRVEAGTGWVNLHYAVDYLPKDGDQIVRWMGGYYDPRISTNPHWDARIRSLPEHPITRGVRPFTLRDEWYFNMRWIDNAEDIRDAKRVQPILQAIPPDDRRGTADAKRFLGRMETLAWASEQPGLGRSFGFTGGHSHRNWGSEPFRRIVVQGILWTAKLEIPTEGAPVALDPIELNRHLDYKGKPFQKILPPADER